MGACGSGLAQSMGPKFAQFVACEKGKEFVDKKVKDLKKVVEDKGKNIREDGRKLIDEKEKEIKNKFD